MTERHGGFSGFAERDGGQARCAIVGPARKLDQPRGCGVRRATEDCSCSLPDRPGVDEWPEAGPVVVAAADEVEASGRGFALASRSPGRREPRPRSCQSAAGSVDSMDSPLARRRAPSKRPSGVGSPLECLTRTTDAACASHHDCFGWLSPRWEQDPSVSHRAMICGRAHGDIRENAGEIKMIEFKKDLSFGAHSRAEWMTIAPRAIGSARHLSDLYRAASRAAAQHQKRGGERRAAPLLA